MSSSLPTIGIILLVLGLIVAVIGGIVLIVNSEKGKTRSWWMWALLIGGGILALVGLLMWIFFRESSFYSQMNIPLQENYPVSQPMIPEPMVAQRPLITPQQAPVTTQYIRTQQTYANGRYSNYNNMQRN